MGREIDWSAIRAEWIAGQLSIRQLARAHGLSDRAIRNKAERDNWPARKVPVRRSAPNKRRSAVRKSADHGDLSPIPSTPLAVPTKVELVHPIERVFALMEGQRTRIQKLLGVVDSLFKELEQLLLVADLDDSPNDEGEGVGEKKPGRSSPGKTLKLKLEITTQLAGVLRILHMEERRVFGIAEDIPTELDRMSPEELRGLREVIRRYMKEISQ
jgi:hypothetical protein